MMDLQNLINGLLAAVSAIVAWFARELWSTTKAQNIELNKFRHDQNAELLEVRREIADLKEEIARNRVHREDFKEAMREVKEMLNRIIEKLERKADK